VVGSRGWDDAADGVGQIGRARVVKGRAVLVVSKRHLPDSEVVGVRRRVVHGLRPVVLYLWQRGRLLGRRVAVEPHRFKLVGECRRRAVVRDAVLGNGLDQREEQAVARCIRA